MLNQAIEYFPDYYDAYIYRGKLFIKEKQYERAILDFQQAINIDQEKGIAYLNKADCLRSMGQNQKYNIYNNNYNIDNIYYYFYIYF